MRKLIILITFLIISISYSQAQQTLKTSIVQKVNKVRSQPHYCGGKYMPASDPVKWNGKLFRSANAHAKEMKKYNYFAHFSRKGESIGKRVDKTGYKWLIVGENIAIGQKTFDETLEDWMESKTHCEMLLNPKIKEIGSAKSGKYRVMHFGRRS